MNTNPQAKRILIYGDSLVYGKGPKFEARFAQHETFPGVIQNALGSDYEIIAEGLRGRMLDGENPLRPERNGLKQFGAILGSHIPLHLVIIMLGTNDCNRASEKSAAEFHQALQAYLDKVQSWHKAFQFTPVAPILVVAPPAMVTTGILQDEVMNSLFGEQAQEKSAALAGLYEQFCREHKIAFFDAGTVCSPNPTEGVHLDIENNQKLGQALAEVILQMT